MNGAWLYGSIVGLGFLVGGCRLMSVHAKEAEETRDAWRRSFNDFPYLVSRLMDRAEAVLPSYDYSRSQGIENWRNVFEAIPWPKIEERYPLGTWEGRVLAKIPKRGEFQSVERVALEYAGFLRYGGTDELNTTRMKIRDAVESWVLLADNKGFREELAEFIPEYRVPLILYAYLQIHEAGPPAPPSSKLPGPWIRLPDLCPILKTAIAPLPPDA